MSFDIINHTLSSAVADNGTFTVSYPSGRSAGSYVGSYAHKLYVNQTVFEAPVDFTLAFTTVITVTWKADTTLAAGSEVSLQVDIPGSDDRSTDVVLPAGVKQAALHLIDLGSPVAASANGIAASQSVGAAGSFVLTTGTLDVPRNIVAAWTTASVLTITGTDVEGNVVVETSASGEAHTGKKAFKTITSITSSAAITGATVGWGDVLGLPVFLPHISHIYGELVDGVNVQAPPAVFVQGLQTEANVDNAVNLELISPVSGTIKRMSTMAQGGITTGGAVTLNVNTVAVNGLSVTIADSAAAGDYDTDTPTAGHASTAVAAGDRLSVVFAAAFNGSADIAVVIEIQPAVSGTAVAGVTSAATATTGDVRGTYDPASACDGALAFQLLVALADPTAQGVPQYAG